MRNARWENNGTPVGTPSSHYFLARHSTLIGKFKLRHDWAQFGWVFLIAGLAALAGPPGIIHQGEDTCRDAHDATHYHHPSCGTAFDFGAGA